MPVSVRMRLRIGERGSWDQRVRLEADKAVGLVPGRQDGAVEKVAAYVETLPTKRKVAVMGERGPNTDRRPAKLKVEKR